MKKLPIALAAASVALTLAACDSSTTSDAAGATTAPATSSSQAAPLPSGLASLDPIPSPTVTPEPISLAVRKTTVKGVEATIVTINGFTAYRFEADENKPSKVNCLDDCLVTWPPALTDGSEVKVSGIDPSLVGAVTRADGLRQVTLLGWPLYKFVDDKAPTDILGEGVGGNWSAVKPDGKPVIVKSGQA
ncbi:hypothetical protein [Micromonospora aurantiaca]|uniref:hypothetical protein n=1 Tax=Micromonospora aurantiaca (nom. illeg.) TaxID=47850 RepID=UPI0011CE9527|nr:hypothetical protein [Micromonospora aurantiaca]